MINDILFRLMVIIARRNLPHFFLLLRFHNSSPVVSHLSAGRSALTDTSRIYLCCFSTATITSAIIYQRGIWVSGEVWLGFGCNWLISHCDGCLLSSSLARARQTDDGRWKAREMLIYGEAFFLRMRSHQVAAMPHKLKGKVLDFMFIFHRMC